MHHEFSLQVTVTDTERPCYAFCLSVVSFNSTVFYYYYFSFRFTLCAIKCSSVVFGITLRRRLPSKPNATTYQQLVSSTCRGLSQMSVLHLAVMEPGIAWESPTPPAFDALVRGSLLESCQNVWCGKLEWCGYPMFKKLHRYVYLFW